MVPDQVMLEGLTIIIIAFQSALRFAVVPDSSGLSSFGGLFVSIRFKVRGGFRPVCPGEDENVRV